MIGMEQWSKVVEANKRYLETERRIKESRLSLLKIETLPKIESIQRILRDASS
jgi:hypothetical protein